MEQRTGNLKYVYNKLYNMKKNLIAIRDVDEEVLRKFRAKAIEEKLKMGDALTLAMKTWMEKKDKKMTRIKFKLKPFDWGKGTEKTSREIDKLLYGGEG